MRPPELSTASWIAVLFLTGAARGYAAPGDPKLERSALDELTLSSNAHLLDIVVLPDRFGRGGMDLCILTMASRMCGLEAAQSTRSLVDGPSFHLGPQDPIDGQPQLATWHAPGEAAWILQATRDAYGTTPSVQLSEPGSGRVLWALAREQLPLDDAYAACLLAPGPQVAVPDVVIASAWARREPSAPGSSQDLGAVALLAGDDGRVRWVRRGERVGGGFGLAVAPAGDVDGDGVADVAVLVSAPSWSLGEAELEHQRVEVLSGRDGSTLGARAVPQYRVLELEPLGDLDSDGLPDLAVLAPYYPANHDAPLFGLSSRAEIAPSFEDGLVLWFAPAGDIDGDGHDDLILAVREDPDSAPRLLRHSALGTQPYADYPDGLPTSVYRVRCADLDGDGLHELVVGWSEQVSSFSSRTRVTLVPGFSLRRR